MYLLFIYDSAYPDGGRNDFVKSSTTLKECIEYFKNGDENKDNADIFDTKLNRWYSFSKKRHVEQVVTTQLEFIPEISYSEDSLQAEREVYNVLNNLVPMKPVAFHLQTK